jgi:hypothetical protein
MGGCKVGGRRGSVPLGKFGKLMRKSVKAPRSSPRFPLACLGQERILKGHRSKGPKSFEYQRLFERSRNTASPRLIVSSYPRLRNRPRCLPRLARQRCDFTPKSNALRRISTMSECVFVALRRACGSPAMHTAAAVSHCGRLALSPAPCPRLVWRALVDRPLGGRGLRVRRFLLQGVVPQISRDAHPPPL